MKPALVGDGKIDLTHPEAMVYAPGRDRAIGKTDTSRLLDHEIEQREKSRQRRQRPSGPNGG